MEIRRKITLDMVMKENAKKRAELLEAKKNGLVKDTKKKKKK